LDFKAGFVAIVGRPNVGKSTLLNRILGEKLSIVTPKPQTTRLSIRGFYNSPQGQIIFLDTPGFLEARYTLHEKMLAYLDDAIKGADVVLFMTDISAGMTEYDTVLLDKLRKSRKPMLCVHNKADIERLGTDTINGVPTIIDQPITVGTPFMASETTPATTFTISALKDENFTELLDKIFQLLPTSPPLYNTDDLSDMPMRFFAQEIIREKIFLLCDEEVPYCSTVFVEKWTEETDRDVIQANIWLERETQKGIIIGKNGDMIGRIRKAASQDISKLTGRRVVLNLWVKVKHDWRRKAGALHEFGY